MLIDNEYIPSYTVFMLHHNELVKEKIQAALTRKKPRDFYDVYYLLRAQMIDVSLRPLLRKVPAILDEEKLILSANFRYSSLTVTGRSSKISRKICYKRYAGMCDSSIVIQIPTLRREKDPDF